jgi:hypothetical protein
LIKEKKGVFGFPEVERTRRTSARLAGSEDAENSSEGCSSGRLLLL